MPLRNAAESRAGDGIRGEQRALGVPLVVERQTGGEIHVPLAHARLQFAAMLRQVGGPQRFRRRAHARKRPARDEQAVGHLIGSLAAVLEIAIVPGGIELPHGILMRGLERIQLMHARSRCLLGIGHLPAIELDEALRGPFGVERDRAALDNLVAHVPPFAARDGTQRTEDEQDHQLSVHGDLR